MAKKAQYSKRSQELAEELKVQVLRQELAEKQRRRWVVTGGTVSSSVSSVQGIRRDPITDAERETVQEILALQKKRFPKITTGDSDLEKSRKLANRDRLITNAWGVTWVATPIAALAVIVWYLLAMLPNLLTTSYETKLGQVTFFHSIGWPEIAGFLILCASISLVAGYAGKRFCKYLGKLDKTLSTHHSARHSLTLEEQGYWRKPSRKLQSAGGWLTAISLILLVVATTFVFSVPRYWFSDGATKNFGVESVKQSDSTFMLNFDNSEIDAPNGTYEIRRSSEFQAKTELRFKSSNVTLNSEEVNKLVEQRIAELKAEEAASRVSGAFGDSDNK